MTTLNVEQRMDFSERVKVKPVSPVGLLQYFR